MDKVLGRPVQDALKTVPQGTHIEVIETAAPVRNGEPRREGTLRVIRCRGNTWVAARFPDGAPRRKEEA